MDHFKFPGYNEIPDVGLYLEQVTKYINQVVSPLGIVVTGSMISNYVKKGIISKPVKKQYSREQIALLIFITLAKSIMSLEDLQLIISLKNSDDEKEGYEQFCNEFLLVMGYVFEEKALELPAIEVNSKEKLVRNMIVAICHKLYLDESIKEIKDYINKNSIKD